MPELDSEPAETRALSVRDRESPVAEAAAPTAIAARVQSLQHSAGNRAVTRLLERRAARPLARLARGDAAGTFSVPVTVPPFDAITREEVAVKAVMQALHVDRKTARDIVEQAPGHPSGPLGPGEVGHAISVGVPLPALSDDDATAFDRRTSDFAALPAAEQAVVDAEADRRFWERTGLPTGTMLPRGSRSSGLGKFWLRTRDGVMRDREQIRALPQNIKKALGITGSAGPALRPDQYEDVLRIAGKLQSFSETDWAVYQRRVTAKTSDLKEFEASIDRYLASRNADQAVLHRIDNTLSLYRQLKSAADLKFMIDMGMPSPPDATIDAMNAALRKALSDANFASADDYEEAHAAFLRLFRDRAVELTLYALRISERQVRSELGRYQQLSENQALFDRLAKGRALEQQAWAASLRSMPKAHVSHAAVTYDKRTPAQEAAAAEAVVKYKQAEEEREAAAEQNPVLKDKELPTWKVLSAPDAAALGELLRKDATNRLDDIDKTRKRVNDDPDVVFGFPRVMAMTFDELGVVPGSVQAEMVRDRQYQIETDKLFIQMAVAVLAIGLGILTAGGGTLAVLAAAGGLVLSTVQAEQEWERYDEAFAAAHTAFSTDLSISGDEPTAVWLALSLIAVGFDGAALLSAMKAAAPAARVVAAGGTAAEFDKALAQTAELSEAAKAALRRSREAEQEFRAAAEDLAKYWRSRLGANPILDPVYQAKVVKAAYYGVKDGIRRFDLFLARLKLQKFMKGIDLAALKPEELAELEKLFKQGIAEFDAAMPAFSLDVKYASGTSKLTISEDGKLLLDGKAVGETKRLEILKQLGLTHANRGHGALRDPLTIANEALQNAARVGGEGKAGLFASDQAMLRSFDAANRELAAGRGVRSGARTLVDIPATPDTGRVFIATSRLPAGVTPVAAQPFSSLPGVAEVQVTGVRALYTETAPGVFEIFDIFPTGP